MSDTRTRRLVVGDTVWWWSVRHRHAPPHCGDVLSLRRDGTRGTLRLVFRQGPGRFGADALTPSGTVGDGRTWLNLHLPRVVRRFLDAAVADGLIPTVPGPVERDGWPLFDTLAAAPPDVPPPPAHP
ncbi:hypothetical protein [Streptomyces avicenniae]|uniref:hypothetical protein n=1 Tax=Streptomyces avicenniae TaxID=500153 RepID=UPI00069B3AE9|nr:hypothetical protein [Streptomyces avicenniae]